MLLSAVIEHTSKEFEVHIMLVSQAFVFLAIYAIKIPMRLIEFF